MPLITKAAFGRLFAFRGAIDPGPRRLKHLLLRPCPFDDYLAEGSSRYAHELNLPGLRSWPLSQFPSLAFFFEHQGQIDVWRRLLTARDIPAWMKS